MLGTLDPFDFILAQDLGKSLAEVRAMANLELVEWRAFYKYRHAMQHQERTTVRSK